MNRFTLTIAACLASALTLVSALPAQAQHRKAQSYDQALANRQVLDAQQAAQSLTPAQYKAQAATAGLITQQPAGTLHDKLIKTSPFMYPYRFPAADINTYDAFTNGPVAKYVEDADGNLYIYQPFSALNSQTWVKAEKQANGHYAVHKQPVYVVDGVTYYTGRLKIDVDSKGGIWWSTDKDRDDVEYVLRNDSLILLDDGLTNGYGNTMLGLIDKDNKWYGYADWSTIMAVNHDKVNVPPASAKRLPYRLTYYTADGDEINYIVDVVRDGKDFYIGNFFKRLPEGWIKGTVDQGTVTFPTMQYMGCDYTHAYFRSISDKGTRRYYTKSLSFAYDTDRGILQSDSAFHVNNGRMVTNVIQGYYEPSLRPYVEKAGVPENPELLTEYCFPYEDGSFGFISFNLPTTTADGSYLNTNKAYYIIYKDGEPYTFTHKYYKYIDEGTEMTEVPFDYSEGLDFTLTAQQRGVYFYEPFKRLSVQVVYYGGGERNVSKLVTYDTDPSGINEATTVSDGTATYYDLTGRRVNRPAHGLYIKSVKRSDGTVVNTKVSLK